MSKDSGCNDLRFGEYYRDNKAKFREIILNHEVFYQIAMGIKLEEQSKGLGLAQDSKDEETEEEEIDYANQDPDEFLTALSKFIKSLRSKSGDHRYPIV